MAKKQARTNPFYVLLVIFGVIFCITASAYGIMALKFFSPAGAQDNSDSGVKLMKFLNDWGMWLLIVELVLLGISTFAAMATDSYWSNESPEKGDNAQQPH